MRSLFVNSRIFLRLLCILALTTLGMATIVGSGGGQDITGGGVTITSITVTPSAVPDGLPVDLTMQFTATAEYSDNTTGDVTGAVTWSSSNTNVATISVVGMATGVAVGTTNISASMSGVASNAVSLEVISINLTKIEITPAIMPNDLPLGVNQQFTALGTFDNYKSYDITNLVTWNSSNLNAATIGSNTGMLASVAPATTIVTASAFGRTSNAVSVTVVDNKSPEAPIIVEPQWIGALPVNRTYQMKALIRYSDNSTYDITDRVTWTSNDITTAVVNDDSALGPKGLVTAISTGGFTTRRVTIDVLDSSTGRTGSATIDVNNAVIVSVDVSATETNSLPVNYSRRFSAIGQFSDGISRKLTNSSSWVSSNTSLAVIDQVGGTAQVRGVASGNVTISYIDYLADGSATGQAGSVALAISDTVLQSISTEPVSSFTFPTEVQQEFSARGYFADGLPRNISYDVVWDSSNISTSVFGINEGILTTVNPGSTTVAARSLNSSGTLISSPAISVTTQNETLQSLVVSPNPGTVGIGDTQSVDFKAMATFSNIATQVDYTESVYWSWAANNFDFVTVSTAQGTKGVVTGIKAGGPFTLNVQVPGLNVIPTPTAVISVQ